MKAETKKNIKIITIILIIYGLWWSMLPLWWSFRGFIDPKYYENIKTDFESRPTKFLPWQLTSRNYNSARAAYEILLERKDPESINMLIGILKRTKDVESRGIIMKAIANLNGSDAIPVILQVVDKYKDKKFDYTNPAEMQKFDDYMNALEALSIMEYEPIYPLILDLAKTGDSREKGSVLSSCLPNFKKHSKEIIFIYTKELYISPVAWVVDQLKELGDPDAIPYIEKYLEESKDKISDYDRKQALETIEYLKSLQK